MISSMTQHRERCVCTFPNLPYENYLYDIHVWYKKKNSFVVAIIHHHVFQGFQVFFFHLYKPPYCQIEASKCRIGH